MHTSHQTNFARMEFHISCQARDLYNFDETLFSLTGNVLFANFHAARVFAQKMNAKRDLVHYPEQVIRAGQINAMGLIDEILHHVFGLYRQQRNPNVMAEAFDWLNQKIGADRLDEVIHKFAEQFPPVSVYRRELGLEDYLAGQSVQAGVGSISNRQIVLEELIMLWLANANPAFSPYLELFDDADLEKHSAYNLVITELHAFFDTQPFFGPDHQNLIDMLRKPAIAVPHSLTGQLEYIRTHWSSLLGRYLYRLLSSLDLIKEEEKAIFGAGGGGPSYVLEFAGQEAEPERFSPDKDWMPNLVLIAKNSYVWLDQLSKKYRRPITRLDEIPEEELDSLSRWGFSGLWLIGLWERSMASKTIKQLRGNQDAVASAYSLFSYDIAADLGGDEAYRSLRDRAWKRGIRLASDMVPNHMGIDSRWVIEHPDWFISLDYSPFPTYSFNGPNLSWDSRVGIYIEDHYYNSTDAAVVFKRVDYWTGSEKFIYHGNDGTSMPWNDTAQLNYLKAEVREAVIQTILHVARKFPVIRFDAAMTLAKKHYQRLWFPEPGSGGAIPTRAEHGLTKEQFNEFFPVEFWREVVDRVAQEVPDTLLLAEAFWMMEGYFVRTLGMHRVYNSAFMNMLRDEKNQEYRQAIKNTLEFEPEILKRYVNFMNNPDERTAVEQFGKGDKYFGICTIMSTLPGLPMFGHGQVEGYTEKYGMEFRRAYWDERPDPYLVERHEREIFPLLRRRYLFAEVRDFLFYDFFTPEGYVSEDVFAYSNKAGNDRSLVLYHNKFASTKGWIRTSVAALEKHGDERRLTQHSLAEGLGLQRGGAWYTIFRDHLTNLEYIRNNEEIYSQGLYAELEAYKCHVFLDFREVQDNEWGQYAQLASYLGGSGVPSIDEALKEIFLQPVHGPFRDLVNPGMFSWLIENRYQPQKAKGGKSVYTAPETLEEALDETEQKTARLLGEVRHLTGGTGDEAALAAQIRRELEVLLKLPAIAQELSASGGKELQQAFEFIRQGRPSNQEAEGNDSLDNGSPALWGTLFGWLFTRRLGETFGGPDPEEHSRTWIDEWLLGKILAGALQGMGLDEGAAWRSVSAVKLLIGCQHWCDIPGKEKEGALSALQAWLKDPDVQRFISVNRFQGVLWYNKEAFEEMLWWLFVLAIAQTQMNGGKTEPGKATDGLSPSSVETILACFEVTQKLRSAEEQSNYQVEKLIQAAKA